MGASDLLGHIAPGQTGTLLQGGGNWREVRCERVGDTSLLLSLYRDQGEGMLSLSSSTYFQTIMDGGVVRVEGSLEAIDPRNLNFGLRFHPSEGQPELINRRQAFRVSVGLKGRLTGVRGPDANKPVTQWEVALRDLSVGGARMVLRSPPPHAKTLCELTLPLGPSRQPLELPCRVISAQAGRNPSPLDAMVRVAFHMITARQESTLFRYINELQLEMLKKGLR